VETEQGFRALVDALPVGMVWLDQGGRPVDWNETAEIFLGCGAGPRLEEAIARLHAACAVTGTCVQTHFELSSAERLQISVAPDRIPQSFLVVLDRQKLEKARTEASVLRAVLKAIASGHSRRDALQKALDTVSASLPVGRLAFFELDPHGRFLGCVASAGLTDVELERLEPVPNDPAQSLMAVALQHQKPVHVADLASSPGKLPLESSPGTSAVLVPVGFRGACGVLYVSATADVLNEGVLRVVQALGDAVGAVLDLVALEAEAARAREVAAQRDRLATIGQLVAGVAHEINNPLAFLKSNLHSLKAELSDRKAVVDPESEVDDIVAESLEGVSRIETIVQALKGTARKTQEKIRFDPARSVTEAVTIFRGAKKAECEIDCQLPPLPEVVGSPSAIGQVALNLMQNGLDAMGAQARQARKLEIRGRTHEDRVFLAFRDHGCGIPPEVQRRMFDAFYTTKDPGKGTGLGLYICKEIVEGMGGQLRFVTGPDGTTFECELPAAVDD
jgi:C4-dicarboxylate-specific signal transduction histidine kinase